MTIYFLWPGKTKNSALKTLIEEYSKRLSRFTSVKIVETSTFSGSKKMEKEDEKLLAQIPSGAYIILLSERGKTFTTERFSKKLEQVSRSGVGSIVFIIGGEDGFTKILQDKSDMLLSLTPMTMTHEMTRMVLVEQIYRVFTIWNNHPYHKW